MPVIKKDKVDYDYDQLYIKPQEFLKTLPDLVKRNLASGDYRQPISSCSRLPI